MPTPTFTVARMTVAGRHQPGVVLAAGRRGQRRRRRLAVTVAALAAGVAVSGAPGAALPTTSTTASTTSGATNNGATIGSVSGELLEPIATDFAASATSGRGHPAVAGAAGTAAALAAIHSVGAAPHQPPPEPDPDPEPGPGSGSPDFEIFPDPPADPAAPDGPGAAPDPAAPGAPAPGTAPGTAESSCGFWDLTGCISQAITSFLRGAITDALNPGLELLSGTLLTTPTLEQMPRVGELWAGSWQILLACYAVLIMVAGVVLMTHETLQTRYSLRELLPRLVVGFFAGALSLLLAGMAIDIANGLSRAVMSGGINPDEGAEALGELVLSVFTDDGGLFLLLLGVVVAVMLIALLLVYIVRVSFTVLLIAGAPIALMLHALPQTEGVAYWWWRAFGGCLAVQVLQSLVLTTALRVFLNDGGDFAITLFGATPTSTGWINILVTITLLWILWKIPFWVLGAVRGHNGGRSLLGSAVRAFVAYKTFGLLRGAGAGLLRRGSGSGGGGRKAGTPGDGSGDRDPYAQERATPDGQLMLPLPGLRRQPRRRTTPGPGRPGTATAGGPHGGPSVPAQSPPPGGRGRRGAGRQLALPLQHGDWPEHRPVLGPGGQYQLPIDVERVPRPTPPAPPAPGPRRRNPAGRQLQLPLADPQARLWAGNRPLASGQYPLPLGPLPRQPRPAPPPTPTPLQPPAPVQPPPPPVRTSTRRPPRPVQMELPFDPYQHVRALRGGQYPLPLDGLTRHPRPAPPPPAPAPTPAAPVSRPPRGRQLRLPLDLPARTPAPPPPATPSATPAQAPGPAPGEPTEGRAPRRPGRPRRNPS